MRFSATFAAFALASLILARPLPDQNGIPFDRLNSFPTISGRSPAGATMSPNGKHIVYAWNMTGARKRDLWILEYPSGQKRQLIGADQIERPLNQDDNRTEEQKKEQELYDGGFGGGAVWSPDSKEFLFSHRGRTWRYLLETKQYEPLFDGAIAASNFEYSKDGKYLVFLYNSNVWRMDRKNGGLKQLTYVSRGGTAVGGFAISPDCKWVAVNWSNFGTQGSHVMMDFTQDRSSVRNISRMWNGDIRSLDEQYGIVPINGGLIKYATGIPRAHWGLGSRGAGWQWAPDSSGYLIGWKSEDHKEWTLSYISVNDAKQMPIYQEKAPKNYINNWRPFEWSQDSESIFLGTDISEGAFTNRHIIKLSKNGRESVPYFKKPYDVAGFQKAGDTDRLILTTQSRNPLVGELTILEPSGATQQIVLKEDGWSSPVDFENAGEVLCSDDGRSIATMAGGYDINPELYAVTPAAKRLTISQLPEFEKLKWAKPQIIEFKAPDGSTIFANMTLPPGYTKGQRIPFVISNMYANSGKLDWDGYLSNYMSQALGFGVVKVDFRASWGQGGEFNSGYYQKMGLIDSEEAVACKKWLVDQGYADPDRCGVWGWSYGGFLTCMIQLTQPGHFKTGVAVASVTDWKSYNHWYTRQRLGLADKDKAIFEKTSPITYADKLKDDLLLVHGMLDDNVLLQDSVRLSMKMIDSGMNFGMFYYPRDDHSIGRDETRKHVQRLIAQHLYDQLGN